MKKNKSLWTHPKFKNREYIGAFQDVNGVRRFVISLIPHDRYPSQRHEFNFSGAADAKKNGWVKG